MRSPLRLGVAAACLITAGCGSRTNALAPPGSPDDAGQLAFRDGSGAPGGDGGVTMFPDGGAPDPHRPGNETRDTDCDGLSDAHEFGAIWASGLKTDPGNPDSDGDGLVDGLESGSTTSVDPACAGRFNGDAEPSSTTDPTRADGDGDGLPDGAEDADKDGVFHRVRETNPRDPDTDDDGRCDGPNDVAGVCTGGDPDPTIGGMDADMDGVPDAIDPDAAKVDTDGDGLCDGSIAFMGVCGAGEDLNGDGVKGPSETDPRSIDTDCDGLVDGDPYAMFRGERERMTDPNDPDSDGDGLLDGLELGVTSAPDPMCAGFAADADPTTTTNPSSADSDGDGVPDGAEDTNQNGAVEMGELDPSNPADGVTDPTVTGACGAMSLVPVERPATFAADIQVATSQRGTDAFSEKSQLLDPARGGRAVGLMGYNPAAKVAYVALEVPPMGADAVEAELAYRGVLARAGVITTPITAAFTTWDGFAAVRATYDLAGDMGVKAKAAAIAQAFVPGAAGLLNTSNDVDSMGGFKVQAEYVRRSGQTMVVVIALVPAQLFDERTGFVLSDVAGGSALAQFGDDVGLQCDRFASQAYGKLDIIWSVDNSQSMSPQQRAVAASAMAMGARLNGATIDWRAAVVTSGMILRATAAGCVNSTCGESLLHQCRPFTTDLGRFADWLTQGTMSWVGAGGVCNQPREEIIRVLQLVTSVPAQGGMISFLPAQPGMADSLHIRQDADLLLILLGDADDQYYENAALPRGIDEYELYFRTLPVRSVRMGGILCPPGSGCRETQRTPRVAHELVNRFNGVIGSLEDIPSIQPSVAAIIDSAVGAVSPYVLSKGAIASTIKVVMEQGSTVGACTSADVPRSRTDGFDYDPQSRAIAFFGNCRPDPNRAGARASVSYRYWIDRSADPDGGPCTICSTCSNLARCDLAQCACVCDQAITCNPGFRWDANRCDCVCDTAALNCGATRMPNEARCACECQPDCGGCADMLYCQQSLCECVPFNL